ncbi:MAG: ferredoxin oxidoreductase [Candidatus Berkelbacteria bacterium]|nr:ferredoxin oxidoreductase [Candidatus Berkelbacteria bacterium]
MQTEFLTGNEVVVKAALSAGARLMFGYPITPSTEITKTFAEEAIKNPRLLFIQTEDEISAGFGVIGAILGGKKSFTSTAGPGTVLMQDPISMAEAMRLPFVGIITQRGGPSTGTVIYSQQEVNLTCFGGNGEGLRIVYSPSNLQEVYDLTIKTFNNAWKYRFPSFLLTDGYLAKAKSKVEIYEPSYLSTTKQILGDAKKIVNIRNTYSTEEELAKILDKYINEYEQISKHIRDYESYHCTDAKTIIFAHGSVASACRAACSQLKRVGLFRPITLRPFPEYEAKMIARRADKVIIVESSAGQFSRMVKNAIFGVKTVVLEYQKPALGITPEEIIGLLK